MWGPARERRRVCLATCTRWATGARVPARLTSYIARDDRERETTEILTSWESRRVRRCEANDLFCFCKRTHMAAAGFGPLPPGWSMAIDASTGRTYYQNDYTQETQWEPPAPMHSVPMAVHSERPEYVFCGVHVTQATHFRLCIILLFLNVGVIVRNTPPICEEGEGECQEWTTVSSQMHTRVRLTAKETPCRNVHRRGACTRVYSACTG